ncbi:NAD-P-binding protein [Umbelopsis sp. PMI_123]|nr:NAD-P-binding protein [Umbelopsis sp. PMI_123]
MENPVNSISTTSTTSPPVLRVGIIGTGEVAQTVHLPTLQLCSHLYRVTALCDVSQTVLSHCASKFNIAKTYTDHRQLISQDDVDVVMILNSDEYHASMAIEAADAGKHVFIEKPMALTLSDADAIIAAEKRNAVVIMVGYMRRYAGPLKPLIDIIHGMKTIHYARVRDIIGHNRFFVSQSGTYPIKATDVPSDKVDDLLAHSKCMAQEVLGENRASDPINVKSYRLLAGLSSHDLSLMRELFGGIPKQCLAAGRTSTGDFMHALFQYPQGFNVMYEVGIDNVPLFDAGIEVFGDSKRVKITYDTPYIKGLPIKVTVQEDDGQGGYKETILRPTYKDPYTLEMEALYKAIIGKEPIKTTPADAKEDLEIFRQMMDKLAPTQ